METTKNFEAAMSLTDIYGQAAAARPILNINQDLKLVSASEATCRSIHQV